MSSAPKEGLDARDLLLKHFPGTEVGIVAGDGSRGTDSYHCGSDWLPSGASYSRYESSRDNRPDVYASAMDFGSFNRNGKNLRQFSLWLVEHCKARTPWTLNIREVIYSPDGIRVLRWDRMGIRSSGDDSHLTHTHVSYFRDSHCGGALAMVKAFVDGDDDMAWDDKIGGNTGNDGRTFRQVMQDLAVMREWLIGKYGYARFVPEEDSTLRNLEKIRFIDSRLTAVEDRIKTLSLAIDTHGKLLTEIHSAVTSVAKKTGDSPR